MNRIDYSEPKAIRNIIYNYDELKRLAHKGDQVAMIICVDVKRALCEDKVLTFKQRRYLGLWWQGFNTIEIAAMYHKEPRTIGRTISKGIIRISKYLCKKMPKTHCKGDCNYGKGVIL